MTIEELKWCEEQEAALEKRECSAIIMQLPLNEDVQYEDTVTGQQLKSENIDQVYWMDYGMIAENINDTITSPLF